MIDSSDVKTTGLLERIRGIVKVVDPGMAPDDDAYKASIILLASANIGPRADEIAELTGYPRSYVRTIGRRLRDNGIWAGRKIACNWFDEGPEGWVSFMCDVNVAMGMFNRVPE